MEGKPQISTPEPFPQTLELHGQEFTFVQTRPGNWEAVYKGPDSFLKVGRKERILEEKDWQQELHEAGAPVAKIIEEGEFDQKYYIREESLGEPLFIEIFKKQTEEGGIRQESFEHFIELVQKYANAQLATAKPEGVASEFLEKRIHIPLLKQEMPELEPIIAAVQKKLEVNTRNLPNVITHADLYAGNMTEKGVIDFASSRRGIAGYDLVTAMFDTYLFPTDPAVQSELPRKYAYSDSQRKEFFDSADKVYEQAGLEPLSDRIDDFIIMRLIWGTVGRVRFPNLKKWRQGLLQECFNAYLHGESVEKVLLTYKKE